MILPICPYKAWHDYFFDDVLPQEKIPEDLTFKTPCLRFSKEHFIDFLTLIL